MGGPVSTLPEVKAFMKGAKQERVVTCSNEPAAGWSGPAYAVAVGRRMGVFRTSGEALSQTLRYSGNSLKKFPTYAEAVEFLDHHNWRKTPAATEEAARVQTSVGTSGKESAAGGEGNPQDSVSPVVTPKRERDEESYYEAPRAAQRRRTDTNGVQVEGNADFIALCYGSRALDDEGSEIVQTVCRFPLHPGWTVVQTLVGSDATVVRAGLLAMLELLTRAEREDPGCKTNATVLTVNCRLFEVIRACASAGWQSVDDDQDLLKRLAEEKGCRCIKLLYRENSCIWVAKPVEDEASQ